jgi:DNA (cytosine-5)-methyltransferase 1
MMQQKRIVTIQECARSQGFPDHYQFLSINKELPKIVQDVRQHLHMIFR